MTSRTPAIETLESRRLFANVLPAFADKIGLGGVIDPAPTFVDDFEGNALDLSKWQIREAERWRPTPNAPEFAWTHRNAMRVGGGELQMIAHNDPATGQLRSGWIQSSYNAAPGSTAQDPKLIPGSTASFQQAYGYWEARLKFDAVSGMWSAFWVHSYKMTEVGNNAARANHPEIYGTEIDVVENGAIRGGRSTPNDMSSVIHANGYGDYHKATARHTDTSTQPNGTPANQYHVYGLLWTPTAVDFYLDGNRVFRETNPVMVSKIPHLIILSNEIGSPSSAKLGEGRQTWGTVPAGGFGSLDTSRAKMTADYVRVWKLAGTVTPTTPTTTPQNPFGGGRETIGTGGSGGGILTNTNSGPGGTTGDGGTIPGPGGGGTPGGTLTDASLWARGGELFGSTFIAGIRF